jgi:hypothetical protein
MLQERCNFLLLDLLLFFTNPLFQNCKCTWVEFLAQMEDALNPGISLVEKRKQLTHT